MADPGAKPLRDQLEIAILTYNRARDLRHTLEQLATSPFGDCRVTVLDNASTDATPEVCADMAVRIPALRVVRHPLNIGGNPNYLRAVENCAAPYLWVLGDDDFYDFSDCDDVVAVLEAGSADLISVGAPHRATWERGMRTTAPELIAQGARFYSTFTFLGNTILRSALFDSMSVSRGYRHVHTLYPSFPFLEAQVCRAASVYVSRGELVQRQAREGAEGLGTDMFWFASWVRACALIEDVGRRRGAIYGIAENRFAWLRRLAVAVSAERLLHPERLWRELIDILLGCRGDQRLLVLACFPLAVVPRGLFVPLRKLSRKARAAPDDEAPWDELRL